MHYVSAWLPEFWRLYDFFRKLGEPDLLKDGLLGAFDLRPVNLLSQSENFGGSAWRVNNLTGSRVFDAARQAFVQDFRSDGGKPAFRNGLWYEPPTPIGEADQELEVAPGETYTFSFFALGIEDYAALELAVLDVEHGVYLTAPTNYGTSLSDREYVRVQTTFRVPEGTTRVRVQAVTQAVPLVVRERDPEAQWAEAVAVYPNRLEYQTRTLTVDGQTFVIPCADLITGASYG